jgi:CheY-like chemotaxis protein
MKIKRQLRKNRNLRQIYFKRQKILLVEDNKINQMITKKMLENKGVTCEVIDNGEDAIEVAKNQSFDLILMDIHLPGINTIATQRIRV